MITNNVKEDVDCKKKGSEKAQETKDKRHGCGGAVCEGHVMVKYSAVA